MRVSRRASTGNIRSPRSRFQPWFPTSPSRTWPVDSGIPFVRASSRRARMSSIQALPLIARLRLTRVTHPRVSGSLRRVVSPRDLLCAVLASGEIGEPHLFASQKHLPLPASTTSPFCSITAIRDRERHAGVLLDEQDRHANAPGSAAGWFESAGGRIAAQDPSRGVHDEHPRIGHQRTGHRQHSVRPGMPVGSGRVARRASLWQYLDGRG